MLNKNYYLASKKIKGTQDSGKKTPLGDMIYEVLLEDNKKVLLPAKRLELQKSEKPVDLTTSRDNFIKPVASAVYSLLHEYGLQISEVNFFCQHLVGLVNAGVDKANKKRWNVEDQGEISLNQINSYLMENVEENKSGSAS